MKKIYQGIYFLPTYVTQVSSIMACAPISDQFSFKTYLIQHDYESTKPTKK